MTVMANLGSLWNRIQTWLFLMLEDEFDELDKWMAQQGDKGMETETQARSRQPGKIDIEEDASEPAAAKIKRKTTD